MAQETHEHHHHHHHHHKMDDASKFKYNSLRSIQLKKKIVKVCFRILVGIAIFMAILTVGVYTFG